MLAQTQSTENQLFAESIGHFTAYRLRSTLQCLSQMLFLATKRAVRGFGRRTPIAADYDRVTEIRYSINWAATQEDCASVGTLSKVRQAMVSIGLFEVETFHPQSVGGKCKSPITRLFALQIAQMARLARWVFNEIVRREGFEALDRDHKWGQLAAIVYAMTGRSLFTANDDYEPTEQARSVQKARLSELLQADIEVWMAGNAEVKEIVEASWLSRFGNGWRTVIGDLRSASPDDWLELELPY